MARIVHASIAQDIQNAFFDEVNSAGRTIGMLPIGPDTSLDIAAKQFHDCLKMQLYSKFKAINGTVLLNEDEGYMAPIPKSSANLTPACLGSRLYEDFQKWYIPITLEAAETLARTIIQHLPTKGGVSEFQEGTVKINSSREEVFWIAGYGIFSIPNNELGAVYVFGAMPKQN